MLASRTLSKEDLTQYREQGYHIEEGVLSKANCVALTELSIAVCARYPWDYLPWMQPHRFSNPFLAILKHPRIVSIAEQLAGGLVWGLQSTWYHGAPGTTPFNLHQDNYLVKAQNPSAFVSAWCAMQDVTEEMGGLVGYPGSQVEPILPQVEMEIPGRHQDPNGARYAVIPPPQYPRVALNTPRGAVVFMHSHFIHGSGANTTDGWRRALLLTYIRQGETFRAGNRAKREAVDVYS